MFGAFFDKKVERIDDSHVGNQFNSDGKFACRFRKNQACQVIRKRILLPVYEVSSGSDFQRVGTDGSATMWSWSEPHYMRKNLHKTIEFVCRLVVYCYFNCHKVM